MNTMEETWSSFAEVWGKVSVVLGFVGPAWRKAEPHLLCEEFAARHPDARVFLVQKLSDPNPYLAAYAFKCLIRVCNVQPADIPADVLSRQEEIEVQQLGCLAHRETLCDYFHGYFELEEYRKREEARIAKWQQRTRRPPCGWGSGDVLSYRLGRGHYLLLRVIHVLVEDGEDQPLCELLDWVGSEVPQAEVIRNLPIRRNKRYPSESSFAFPMLKKHLARCRARRNSDSFGSAI